MLIRFHWNFVRKISFVIFRLFMHQLLRRQAKEASCYVLGHYPSLLWSAIRSVLQHLDTIPLCTSELLLRLSAVTSSVKTSNPFLLAAIHTHDYHVLQKIRNDLDHELINSFFISFSISLSSHPQVYLGSRPGQAF